MANERHPSQQRFAASPCFCPLSESLTPISIFTCRGLAASFLWTVIDSILRQFPFTLYSDLRQKYFDNLNVRSDQASFKAQLRHLNKQGTTHHHVGENTCITM
jgi:hypothetical protein